MPERIPNYYLDCPFYIYPTEADAKAGKRIGACGFLVSYPLSLPNYSVVYAVTNRHVILGCDADVFLRLNTNAGTTEIVSVHKNNWLLHPNGDDVALLALDAMMENYKYLVFPFALFATDSILTTEDIGIGDEVFLVGRFINHEGRQQNKPTVRFGQIAMTPGEPISNPQSGIMQDGYLIECRSMGGYSGSPVFVTVVSMDAAKRKKVGFVAGLPRGPYLLGINWCHLNYYESVKEFGETSSTTVVTIEPPVVTSGPSVLTNSGMAGVVPVARLIELLELDEVKALRNVEEEALRLTLTSPSVISPDTEDSAP